MTTTSTHRVSRRAAGLPGFVALVVAALATSMTTITTITLTAVAAAPAEAAGPVAAGEGHRPAARLARLQQAVKNAQLASSATRTVLVEAQDETTRTHARAVQAAKVSDAAARAADLAAQDARGSAAALAAAQAGDEAARAEAAAAADRAARAGSDHAAQVQAVNAATGVSAQAQQAFNDANRVAAITQDDLDREKARWDSCTRGSGRFMCRRTKNDSYQPVPRLDGLFDLREAAERAKNARYQEWAVANQALAQARARSDQAAGAARDAQASADAAGAARDRAAATRAAAVARRDQSAQASVRAASAAADAAGTAVAATAAEATAQAVLETQRAAMATAAAKLSKATAHLRQVKRQLHRRR